MTNLFLVLYVTPLVTLFFLHLPPSPLTFSYDLVQCLLEYNLISLNLHTHRTPEESRAFYLVGPLYLVFSFCQPFNSTLSMAVELNAKTFWSRISVVLDKWNVGLFPSIP